MSTNFFNNMKKIIFLVLTTILTITSQSIFAQDNNKSVIDSANLYYSEAKYEKAIELYNSVIDNGLDSAELYYNIGNAYFKNNDIAYAILYFEKAKKLQPNNDDINFNLEVANSRISDKIEEIPELFYKKWWKSLTNLYSVDTWAKISIFAISFFFVFALIYFLSKKVPLRKFSFYSGIILIIIFIISINVSLKKHKSSIKQNEGIIFTPSITVKSSPNKNSVDLFLVHEGTKIKVIDKLGEWFEIKIANGSEGWLKKNHLKMI